MYLRIVVLIVGLLNPMHLLAQLSPGPLSEPHAYLSGLTNCLSCHTWGSKDLTPKCLECHTPIQARIDEELGFHGQLKEKDCLTCHRDHLDRDFKMIHWEPSQNQFDHLSTGYELESKHAELDCQDCHNAELIIGADIIAYSRKHQTSGILDKTFLGLGTMCSDCHSDVHANEFIGLDCENCHDQNDWKSARNDYDHDFETNFPLRGAHNRLECEKCHTETQKRIGKYQVQRFGGLKSNRCTDCHEDKHNGSFGSNCLKCHTETTFKQENVANGFNHTATRYPLIGLHARVECELCHTRQDRFTLDSSFDDCSDCHRDYHEGIFQKPDRTSSCDDCHSVRGFFPPLFGVFEHRNTRFGLDGAHLAQPCIYCHKSNSTQKYRWDPLSCVSCHDSVHGSQFSRYKQNNTWCETCHKTSNWTDLVFDHATTFFPLTDKHSQVECAACHTYSGDWVQYENVETRCDSCHRDVHSKQFDQQLCDDCHSSKTWQLPEFDHTSLTIFPLDGQHKDLACGQCHKFESVLNTVRFKPIAHQCQDCHSFEDYK